MALIKEKDFKRLIYEHWLHDSPQIRQNILNCACRIM